MSVTTRNRVAVNGDRAGCVAVNGDRGHQKHFVGSKGGEGVWQRIISEMPPHNVFVESFVGTGIITRMKRPAKRTVVIDLDPDAPGLAIPGVEPFCTDALNALSRMKVYRDWLIYCDPPYLSETRSYQGDYYLHEMKSPAEHRKLLLILNRINAPVMISGYRSRLYDTLLDGWRTIEIPTIKRNGQRAVEVVWCNFPEPFFFHDTRFLGRNKRERERIKRKKGRWRNRLQTMSRIDRAAVTEAIRDLVESSKKWTYLLNAVAGIR